MKIIEPSYEIMTEIDGEKILKDTERILRTCYKSEDHITDDSAKKIVQKMIDDGSEAMLEFGQPLTVKFICDRGVSHELVRHRHCSFAQESTRYCNYSKDKFGNELTFIRPLFFEEGTTKFEIWHAIMSVTEGAYLDLIEQGSTPQEARSVLPNSLKTEIVVSANLREWRHIFRMRTSVKAHPQMRQLMIPLLEEVKEKIPVFFDDIEITWASRPNKFIAMGVDLARDLLSNDK